MKKSFIYACLWEIFLSVKIISPQSLCFKHYPIGFNSWNPHFIHNVILQTQDKQQLRRIKLRIVLSSSPLEDESERECYKVSWRIKLRIISGSPLKDASEQKCYEVLWKIKLRILFCSLLEDESKLKCYEVLWSFIRLIVTLYVAQYREVTGNRSFVNHLRHSLLR